MGVGEGPIANASGCTASCSKVKGGPTAAVPGQATRAWRASGLREQRQAVEWDGQQQQTQQQLSCAPRFRRRRIR